MTKHAITIEIDEANLTGYTDEFLAACWHVAQHNPAACGDAMACDLTERIGREIIRRATYSEAPEAAGPAAAGRHPVNAELNARRTAATAVLGDYKAVLASARLGSPPGREWMLRLASVLEDLLTAISGPDDEDDEDQADELEDDYWRDYNYACSTCGALIGMFIGHQGGWLHYRGDGTTASPVEIYDAGHDATFAMGPGGVS